MRLLLVEDDPKTADLIANGLKAESYAVDRASSSQEAQYLATHEQYDGVVLDRRLPDGDGLSVVKYVRANRVTTPILLLSALSDMEDRVAGLNAGADDYLVKPFAFVELLARLRALLRRGGPMLGTVLKHGDLELDEATRRVTAGPSHARVDLTPREFALLRLFLRHAGATLSRTMITEHVWDYNFDPSSNVVEAHMRRLRVKLQGAGSTTKIETVRGVGYVLQAG
jgi:DNA-binding response OmpR family regulator